MSGLTVTRRIQFCAGHRLIGHEGKCRHVHGHNFVAFVTAETAALDDVGRVVDFSVLKERIGGWIDQQWDHSFIVNETDSVLREFLRSTSQPHYCMGVNPTAENMADHILRVVGPLVLEGTGVHLVKVELWETENCCALAVL